MNQTIGFIGCGNMAKAMIGGIVSSGLVPAGSIIASDKAEEGLNSLKKQYGIVTTADNIEVVQKADILILAVKPNIYPVVIEEIKNYVTEDKLVITIAAGQTIDAVEECFGKKIRLIRTMPNTPAMVGEGMSAMCRNSEAMDEDVETAKAIFESFGKCEVVGEYLIDAVIGVSGSSPAYVYMFIEAMADAAVAAGMPRAQAYTFAAQSVYGSAKMVLETGKHPGELKDMVCSPAGTTIEAVKVLEQEGMRSAVIKAMDACVQKSKDMSKK